MPARRRVFRSATAAKRRLLARRCPRRVTTKTNFARRAKLVFAIFGGENPKG